MRLYEVFRGVRRRVGSGLKRLRLGVQQSSCSACGFCEISCEDLDVVEHLEALTTSREVRAPVGGRGSLRRMWCDLATRVAPHAHAATHKHHGTHRKPSQRALAVSSMSSLIILVLRVYVTSGALG